MLREKALPGDRHILMRPVLLGVFGHAARWRIRLIDQVEQVVALGAFAALTMYQPGRFLVAASSTALPTNRLGATSIMPMAPGRCSYTLQAGAG